ncbi:hypothetical protein GCM10023093_07400 [Nemorincola caseinilytica]|uniref:DUF4190 domain-containing protein n=2 Tax=Nemorincola caseinilytica TaxID=2054315 RepID=A0ABP8N8S1_9BACT
MRAYPEKKESGFYAYFSAACGTVGLLFLSPQFTLALLVLGIAAEISGKMGLKRYRHKAGLRALCYAGIALGFVLLLFAIVPIAFLAF